LPKSEEKNGAVENNISVETRFYVGKECFGDEDVERIKITHAPPLQLSHLGERHELHGSIEFLSAQCRPIPSYILPDFE